MLLLKCSLNKRMIAPSKKNAKVVCDCLGVTEAKLVVAIRTGGLCTVKQVTACTDAGGGCTVCHPVIREYLEREARAQASREAAVGAAYFAPSSPNFSAR